MELEPVFKKQLQETDIEYRLSFPTKYLDILPPFAPDRNEVNFQVRYGNERRVYTFWCIRRRAGPPKPTIARGWSDVVHDKQLEIGDWLRFYAGGQHDPTRYWIEVGRPQLEYSDEHGETWNWVTI